MRKSLLLFVLLLAPFLVFADGAPDRDGFSVKAGASKDPQHDKRLPAVLPGEEVKTEDGGMNVWTTTGPVSVDNAPEPFQKDREFHRGPNSGNSVGIIVDGRAPRVQDNSQPTK